MSILVVEDNALSAEVLEKHLRKHGWTVVRAADGRAALEVLAAAPDVELVITDIQMPELDGLGLIAAVRARPEWKALPIVVTTARASADVVTQAAKLGVRHIAVKPVKLDQLVAQVRDLLRKELPTLRSRQHVQLTLGIDEVGYRTLLRGFGALVAARLAELPAGGSGDGRPSDGFAGRLAELRESATLAGADRVVAAIDAVLASGDGTPLDPLVRELQRVQTAVAGVSGSALATPAAAASAPDDAGP